MTRTTTMKLGAAAATLTDRGHHRHGGLPHPPGAQAEQPVRDGAAEESAPQSGEHRIPGELHDRLPAALLGSAGDGAAHVPVRAAYDSITGFLHGLTDRPPSLYTDGVDGFDEPGLGLTQLCPDVPDPSPGDRSHDPVVGAGGSGYGRDQSLHRRMPAGCPRPLRAVAGRHGPQDL